jgi:hypothetical protein
MEDLRYPIGRFNGKGAANSQERKQMIDTIAGLPGRLREAVRGLSPDQLDTPYRPEGWTVRQVVHHVPESHMNSYIRFKLALTENAPTVKPYDEAAWARLPDVSQTPVDVSLALLDSLHTRWTILLRSLSESEFGREFTHPEIGRLTLNTTLGLYAWHSGHHLAHVTRLRERMGW